LRSAGYEVVMATNGQEALQAARMEHPDLVIADYATPQLSGLELCQRLKHDPQTSGIPSILLGVPGYSVKARTSKPSLFDRRLDKPFASRNLLAAVHEVLEPLLVS
jgi:CheY-like chemotaxis protein